MPIFQRPKRDTAPFLLEAVPNTYVGRLGCIGRQLDSSGCRSVSIVEVFGNYIVRGNDQQTSAMLMTEVVPEDFQAGMVRNPVPPSPSSYEAMFRTLGAELDARYAANIAIVEGINHFHVVGWERGSAGDQLTYVVFDQSYGRNHLQRQAGMNR